MPDKDGKLTPSERKTIVTWLTEKGVNTTCPSCGHDDVFIGNHAISSPIHRGGNIVLGGITYPQIFVSCNNCYFTRYFMAVPMGLSFDSGEEESKKEEDETATEDLLDLKEEGNG